MRLIVRLTAIVAFVAMALFGPVSARAADSACKGLEQTRCESQGCSWVKSYKTAKGRDVSAFCRKKPEKKNTSAVLATPKS